MPKTALGKRAAIEQANQLRLLDPTDPDQKYALLENFGLSDMVPTLNYHVQSALQVQDVFEKWVENPQGPPPLVVKPWFDPHIHWIERIKWLNTDKMREIIAAKPEIEGIITQHLQMLQFLMNPPAPVGPDGQPLAPGPGGPPAQGGAKSMSNSNQNSGAPGGVPSGSAPTPNAGPQQQGPV
jgi:hypothetical protein